jgi:hypothetical protein
VELFFPVKIRSLVAAKAVAFLRGRIAVSVEALAIDKILLKILSLKHIEQIFWEMIFQKYIEISINSSNYSMVA